MQLNNLKNSTLVRKKTKRRGRGPASGQGKTSGRGEKGAGSRSGYTRRYGYEGGQMRLFMKLPHRGFSRGRFLEDQFSINLDQIDNYFSDGEVVNFESLYEKGIIKRKELKSIKILSRGEISKKVTIEAHGFSKEAIKKLESKKIPYKIIEKK